MIVGLLLLPPATPGVPASSPPTPCCVLPFSPVSPLAAIAALHPTFAARYGYFVLSLPDKPSFLMPAHHSYGIPVLLSPVAPAEALPERLASPAGASTHSLSCPAQSSPQILSFLSQIEF